MNRKERTIFVSIVINGLLIAFKFWLASASGSLALRSSALHSTADLAIGIFVLVGLFASRREGRGREAPQRFSAIENWVALGVSAAIFYVGVDIVSEVIAGETPELRNLGPITFASIVTVVVAYVVARYKLYVGRKTDSPALIASGYHSQVDIYASIVVVAGLAGAALGLANLDTAAAAVVAVMIFLSGYQIASSAISALRRHALLTLEGEPNDETVRQRSWWRVYGPAAGALLLMIYLLSGTYTVSPGETAVVRRFGEVNELAKPGLHYSWPAPIDRVDVVATDRIRRTQTPAIQMLTGDENLIAVQASLHYTVSDPAAFVLNVSDPKGLIKQAGAAALRQVVAQEGVDALLTVDKALVQERAAEVVQEFVDRNQAGLRIVGVQLLESSPPPEVSESFRDVASAREDQNTFVNEAIAYRNEVLPVARGDAEKIHNSAIAYAAEKIAVAAGEAAQFSARQQAYARAPAITRQRLFLEAAEQALPGARKFLLHPSVSPETTDLWIAGSGTVQPFPPTP